MSFGLKMATPLHLTRYQLLMSFGLYFGVFGIFAPNHIFTVFGNLEPVWECDGVLGSNCSCAPVNLTSRAGYRSAAMDFEMVCDRAYISYLISTLQMAGVLVGSFVFGQVSDYFGRRPTAIFSVSALFIVSTISLFAGSWQLLAAGRFLTGFLIGATLMSVLSWTVEEVQIHQRMFLRSVANGWGPARIAMVILAYLSRDWRYTFLFCNLLAIPVILIMVFSTVESTRWLAQQGNEKKLKDAEIWIADFNGKEPEQYLESENDAKKSTYLDLFSSWKIAGRTIIMSYIWFTCALVSYGMDIKAGDLKGDIFLTQGILAFALAAARPFAFLIDRSTDWFNRRFLYLATIVLPVATFVLLAMLANYSYQGNRSIDIAMTSLSLIQLVVLEYHWIAIGLYCSELFPTVCRSSGGAVAACFGRMGNVIAPQIMFLQSHWLPLPYVVFAVLGALAIVISYFFLPETKDEDLPDTLKFKSSMKKRKNLYEVRNEEKTALA